MSKLPYRRKERLLEKLAVRSTIYTHLGGLRIRNPKQATEAINNFLRKKPAATIAEVTARFAPGRKPGMGAKITN